MFKAATKNSKGNKSNNTSLFQNSEKGKGTFFQPKLNVGTPGDKYEVEADKVADQVVDSSPVSEQPFFAPSVPPPANSGQPSLVQNKPVDKSITPLLQRQEEPEEMMQMQPVEEEEVVQQQAAEEEESLQMQPEKEEEPLQMQSAGEEEEMVQSQANEEEETVRQQPGEESESLQALNTEGETLQRQSENGQPVLPKRADNVIQKQEKEEEEPREVQLSEEEEMQPVMAEKEGQVQAKSDSTPVVPAGFESGLNGSKGSGSPLPSGVKSQMESGFGTDFSNVRIHTDSGAAQMSRQIGAQAFTHGSDIYFNEGKFNPASESGQHLIAHELTHTVQQGASVQPKLVQRQEGEEEAEVPETGDNYDFTANPPKIFIDELPIPSFKKSFMSGSGNFRAREYSGGGREGENDPEQSGVWDSNVSHEGARQKLLDGGLQNDRLYRISGSVTSQGKKKDFERNGDANLIAQNLKVPFWLENSGEKEYFQIDHKEELQLKGWPRVRTAGQIDNLFLLSAEANQTSGNTIKTNVDGAIQDKIRSDEQLKNALAARGLNVRRINATLANQVKSRFDIHYRSFTDASNPPGINTWIKSDIESGNHIDALMNREKGRGKINFYDFQDPEPSPSLPFDPHPSSLDLANQIGSSSSYVLYWGDNLGSRTKISWEDPNAITKELSTNMFRPRLTMHGKFFNAELMEFNPQVEEGQRGYLRGQPFKFKSVEGQKRIFRLPEYFNWPIYKMPGTTYAGFLRSADLKNFLNTSNAEFEMLSPFTIDHLQITEAGLVGRGTLLPSVPFISKANVEIVITEDDVRLQKVFSSGDLDMPPPFSVSDVTLSLGYGIQRGFFIEGQVDFGIDNVGEGHIGAGASSSGGFELEGAFNFDSELFDPAEINVEYKENIWTIGGTIGIPDGKVRGVKSATITASYSENTFTASGEAELDIPGIQRGNMEVVYGEEGFSISGDFDLKDDIPGIRGGNVSATIAKQNGEEGYNVSVSGTAEPDIPGIDSSLSVSYDNGALTIEGSAAYSRGMLSGTVNIGATNRPIGDDGEPAGDPDDTMRVYGGGSLTLTLTPWLEATAGVQFLPNGEIEVTGRIGLPDTVDVFDRKSIDRNLFRVPAIEIPIFAIPLGPRSIGLVARITGGLDFSAGFGPGQLRDLYGEVTYNPDREEETTISGHGEFAIPADAGLTLRGDLGLGVSVGIASLTGGIEIAGTLGLEGEAAAEVDVNWSPQTGLALDATGRVTVNPKFTFDINAFARASLDLWVTSISETWRYNLASFSWGPDIQFGIVFPVHYREGEPFDMSFDDIEVIYPDLDVVDMAKGLARDIKDDIFD
ncbi:eCIS core domain-containing protein [Mariniphaga sediminis]|jgi:hypothetical protein|nr:DUF4157 domain-containing protein [Mariniphaga sediminis]